MASINSKSASRDKTPRFAQKQGFKKIASYSRKKNILGAVDAFVSNKLVKVNKTMLLG